MFLSCTLTILVEYFESYLSLKYEGHCLTVAPFCFVCLEKV